MARQPARQPAGVGAGRETGAGVCPRPGPAGECRAAAGVRSRLTLARANAALIAAGAAAQVPSAGASTWCRYVTVLSGMLRVNAAGAPWITQAPTRHRLPGLHRRLPVASLLPASPDPAAIRARGWQPFAGQLPPPRQVRHQASSSRTPLTAADGAATARWWCGVLRPRPLPSLRQPATTHRAVPSAICAPPTSADLTVSMDLDQGSPPHLPVLANPCPLVSSSQTLRHWFFSS